MLSNHRKLVACLVGLALIFVKDHTGIDLTQQEDVVVTLVLNALTAASVWYFANENRA